MATKNKHAVVCKFMRESIKRTWGKAFDMLGDEMKEAIICQQVLYVLTNREDKQHTAVEIRDLTAAMREFCGLE